jgi:pimeloyl-ACP methyl ester carboxylesterase
VETGRKAARLAALNALAVARQHLGSLDKVTRIVRLGVSVATSGDVRDQPVLLLLHGFPSSSRMFERLFARLSDRYHLIAPDYPGFGHSRWPDPKKFAYTFDHCAEIVNHFAEALRLSRYTLYMQDYGGPVGFRVALAHPDRIEALIVQNAVAQRRPGGDLEAAPGILGRPRRQ